MPEKIVNLLNAIGYAAVYEESRDEEKEEKEESKDE